MVSKVVGPPVGGYQYPETPKHLNEGIYLKPYWCSYYKFRYIP